MFFFLTNLNIPWLLLGCVTMKVANWGNMKIADIYLILHALLRYLTSKDFLHIWCFIGRLGLLPVCLLHFRLIFWGRTTPSSAHSTTNFNGQHMWLKHGCHAVGSHSTHVATRRRSRLHGAVEVDCSTSRWDCDGLFIEGSFVNPRGVEGLYKLQYLGVHPGKAFTVCNAGNLAPS